MISIPEAEKLFKNLSKTRLQTEFQLSKINWQELIHQ